jgi:CubicO group peptidase (beta-lactamase class C family)
MPLSQRPKSSVLNIHDLPLSRAACGVQRDRTRSGLRATTAVVLFVTLMPSLADGSPRTDVLLYAASPRASFDPSTVADQSAKSSIDPAQLEAFVDETVHASMRHDDIAGVSVAIVDGSGPLLIKGYGVAGRGRAVDADTLFPMQSISKTLVWIALMQLVEQGKIRLEDPINASLPALLQIPDEGFRTPILIRDLVNHTSGFEDSAFGHLFVQRAETLLPLDMYLSHFRVHRVREPGTVQIYSNYGAALGGALVAHVSGMDWEDYAERRIIQPLGMGTATFRQPYSEELVKARALPPPMPLTSAALLTDGFRRGAAGRETAPREFTSDFPAGSLVASPRGMAAYMSALLNPQIMAQAGVLQAQTLASMRTPSFNGPAGFGDMRFGFEAFALPGDIEAFGHGGDSIYQVASMTLIPSRGLGIFVSANTASARALTVALRGELMAKFYGAELAPPVYGAHAYEEAILYAGDYRNMRRPYFRTEHGIYDLLIDPISVVAEPNGDLQIRSFVSGSRLLVPMGSGVYRDKNGPDRIAFRPLDGQIGMYEPYSNTAWERVGYLERAGTAMWLIALTLLTAFFCIGSGIYRIIAPRSEAGFESYAIKVVTASAAAWIAGFALFFAFLAKGLTASNIQEIIWWYPSTALVCACWTFAGAATLTLASVPSLAVVYRSNGWSRWRSSMHALEVLIFVACAATLGRLGFVGFVSW